MTALTSKNDKPLPSLQELKDFALVMSWAFPLFFSLLLPWLFGYAWQLWPLFVPAVLLTLLLLAPKTLRFPHKFWMTFAGVIGWINTRLILGICFYLLITPLGLFMSMLGKLQYRKKSLSSGSNYVVVEAKSTKEDLENPF